MKGKGILTIGIVWMAINLTSYLLFGPMGLVVSNFSCMAIVWFTRKKLAKLLDI